MKHLVAVCITAATLSWKFVYGTSTDDRRREGENGFPKASCTKFYIFLFQPTVGSAATATISNCGAKMLVRGTVSVRTYVHNKATAGEATRVCYSIVLYVKNRSYCK